jgi:hypothetical protein
LARKCTALDWMAVAAEHHGREILEVYLQAMRGGDWRAAEALMSRIYGKPEAPVSVAPASPITPLIASMSLDEKLSSCTIGDEEIRSRCPSSKRFPQPRSPTPAKRFARTECQALRAACPVVPVCNQRPMRLLGGRFLWVVAVEADSFAP